MLWSVVECLLDSIEGHGSASTSNAIIQQLADDSLVGD